MITASDKDDHIEPMALALKQLVAEGDIQAKEVVKMSGHQLLSFFDRIKSSKHRTPFLDRLLFLALQIRLKS